MFVEKNKIVAINYVMKDEEGNLIIGNEGYDPEEYLHGAGNILPRLEHALTGLKQDDVIDVVIPPEEAYGPREVSLLLEVSIEDVDDPESLKEGEFIQLFDGTEGVVLAHKGTHVVVDANHPLAGKTLHYTIRISAVREATEEEIQNAAPIPVQTGACGPAGCC
ncbi:MAG TPA: FKBP-type peptidyl-prolyl cis-trans isomerase [Chitinophagaceae bacterium]|nr:FKBP-type peptidyl-prolyl cis-trans isomerase [Chitinophagaceae bacterium]